MRHKHEEEAKMIQFNTACETATCFELTKSYVGMQFHVAQTKTGDAAYVNMQQNDLNKA